MEPRPKAGHCATGVVALAALAFAAAPAYAKRTPPPPAAPSIVVAPPGPLEALADVRSPNVAHEVRCTLPARIVCAGRALSLAAGRGGQLVATAGPERSTGATDTEVLPTPKVPGLVTFAFHGAERYGVAVRRDPSTGDLLVGSAYGAAVKLGSATGYVVDSDRDGVLGTAGDGVVVPGCRTVAPWCGELWAPEGAVALASSGFAKPPTASPIPMPRPADADHSAAWRRLEWRRQQVAVRPVAYDAGYEADMLAHAAYVVRNGGGLTHDETPGAPGYSAAGAIAGIACSIGKASTCVEGLEEQMRTLFHRHACLNARMERSTLVLQDGIWLLRVHGAESPRLSADVVVFPSHGMTDVAPAFLRGGENPMPLAVPNRTPLGLAIGARHASWGRGPTPTAPSLGLVALSSAGRTEPFTAGVLAAPGRAPAGIDLYDRQGLVAFVATTALAPATTYRATLVVPRPGADEPTPFAYEWEFTTGAGR